MKRKHYTEEQIIGMLKGHEAGVTIEDLGQYHPPQVLPNGDIILRRKTPLENGPTVPRDPAVPRDPGAEVEL